MENKNMIVAISLSLMVLLVWQFFLVPPPQQQIVADAGNQSAQNGVTNNGTNVNGANIDGTAIDSATGTIAIEGNTQTQAQTLSRSGALAQTQRVRIETDRVSGSINLQGGRIDDLILLNYKETLDDDAENVHLFNPANSDDPYYANFGWLGDKSFTTPNLDTIWQSNRFTLTPDNDVTLYWVSPENIRFEKTFTIDDNFMINVTQRVTNNSENPLTIRNYGLVARIGEPDTLNFYILHEGFIGVLDDELIEEDYDDTEDETLKYDNQKGWFGITDKYWLAVMIPQADSFNGAFRQGKSQDRPVYQADFASDTNIIGINQQHSYQTLLFAGAKEVTLLDEYATEYNIDRFDLAVDFGILYFITKPLFQIINKLSAWLGNFGLAILALTVLIKIVFFPLANKAYVSISRMKQLQPEIQEMRENYGEDKQKLQQEMLKMYRAKKVNPMAGCVPMLLQIPVFFALYKVLFVTIEMRHAPFYGWIHDLSAPDPAGILVLFGFAPWAVPSILSIVNIGVWPLLMGFSMWVQQKLNPAPPDPIQQKIFAMLPIVFTFLLATFPAGLVIYWTCNNTLTIAQQWAIMKMLDKKDAKAKLAG